MREISWASHWDLRDLPNGDDVIIWADVAKADALWSLDTLYIPRGVPDHRGKYERFGNWLSKSTTPVEMAHVCVAPGGSLSFTNGRHRFAWVRDHGALAVPFTVWNGQARRLSKLIG